MTSDRDGQALPSGLTHGGGVVWRIDKGGVHLLMVRGNSPPHDWVFPKGHVDPGETVEEAARREVIEEAGVEAIVGRYLGLVEFDSPKGEHVRAGYFLMRFERDVPAHEERAPRWWPLGDVLKLCRYEDSRVLVRAAARALDPLAKSL